MEAPIWERVGLTEPEWWSLTPAWRDGIRAKLFPKTRASEPSESEGYSKLLQAWFESEAERLWLEGKRSYAPWEK